MDSIGVGRNHKVRAYVKTVPGRYRDKVVIEISEWINRDPMSYAPKQTGGQNYRRNIPITKEPNGNEA